MAKILIVDDEPRIRELIRENLQYSGYTCEEAGDGSAALSLLTGGGYDLVFCSAFCSAGLSVLFCDCAYFAALRYLSMNLLS